MNFSLWIKTTSTLETRVRASSYDCCVCNQTVYVRCCGVRHVSCTPQRSVLQVLSISTYSAQCDDVRCCATYCIRYQNLIVDRHIPYPPLHRVRVLLGRKDDRESKRVIDLRAPLSEQHISALPRTWLAASSRLRLLLLTESDRITRS